MPTKITTHTQAEASGFAVNTATLTPQGGPATPAVWCGHPTGGRWLSPEGARALAHALILAAGQAGTQAATAKPTTPADTPPPPAPTAAQRADMDEMAGVQA